MEEDIQNHSPTVMFRGTPCMYLKHKFEHYQFSGRKLKKNILRREGAVVNTTCNFINGGYFTLTFTLYINL